MALLSAQVEAPKNLDPASQSERDVNHHPTRATVSPGGRVVGLEAAILKEWDEAPSCRWNRGAPEGHCFGDTWTDQRGLWPEPARASLRRDSTPDRPTSGTVGFGPWKGEQVSKPALLGVPEPLPPRRSGGLVRTAYFDYETRSIIDVAPNVLNGGYVIARVNTPYQHCRHGIARRLMAELLADADAEGVELWLDINPYGEMTYRQLAAWYGRCGFEKVDVPGGRRYRRLPRDKTNL